MKVLSEIASINQERWADLIQQSSTSTWFQTCEAYDFYAAQPELFTPFVVAVESTKLRGICVGYITMERQAWKQFITRRAIIIGGPTLADDITTDELVALLQGVKQKVGNRAIYIETRNFHDYSLWRAVFEQCGWKYEEHLNFHVDTTDWNVAEEKIGKHRKKYIRLSLRDGATMVENASIEQVKEFYALLQELYRTKVKTPLQPWNFFERLYGLPSCKYLLVEYDGKIVGGSICMLLEEHGVYEWFACGKDGIYKNIHPSSVTKYYGMKYAADNGYPTFDMMGAGKPNEEYGVRDFKAEFGGELVEHGRFQYICNKVLFGIGCFGVKILKMIK